MSDDFEVIFITAKGCSYCARVKEAWKPLFEQGIIKEYPVESKEGLELAKKLNLEYVPACIIKIGEKYRFCDGDDIHEK